MASLKAVLEAHNRKKATLIKHQSRPQHRAILAAHGLQHLLTGICAPLVEGCNLVKIRPGLKQISNKCVCFGALFEAEAGLLMEELHGPQGRAGGAGAPRWHQRHSRTYLRTYAYLRSGGRCCAGRGLPTYLRLPTLWGAGVVQVRVGLAQRQKLAD